MKLGEVKIEALKIMFADYTDDIAIDNLGDLKTDENYGRYVNSMPGAINRCFSRLEDSNAVPVKKFVLTEDLGTISNNRIRFDLSAITGTIPIIKAYAGMGAGILVLLDSERIDGLVIEALGAGNLPPDAVPYLTDLIANGTPVILVSRCFNGIAEAVYGYEGGGVALAQAGVMFVKELNSQKARLKLLIALKKLW